MTFAVTLIWSLIRSGVIASLALRPSAVVAASVESAPRWSLRRLWLMLAVAPLFVPELLVGFHYRLTATWLSRDAPLWVSSAATEGLYVLLQWARALAVGTAVRLMLPRNAVSPEALFEWQLLRSRIPAGVWRRHWLMLKACGPWRSGLAAWSLMALIVFQEFETAALMQIDLWPVAWTVSLFDAHAARQPLTDSLKMMCLPLLCESLLLAPAIGLLLATVRFGRLKDFGADERTEFAGAGKADSRAGAVMVAMLLPGLLLLLVWPVAANASAAVRGLGSLIRGPLLMESLNQILVSAVFAAAATVLTVSTLSSVLRPCGKVLCRDDDNDPGLHTGNRMQRLRVKAKFQECLRTVVLTGLLLCGLTGSLVLSLVLLAAFQMPWLRPLYESWLPMLLGQGLAVFPRALAVGLVLRISSRPESVHSADLLLSADQHDLRRRASAIRWRLTTGRWLLGCLVIAHWCFWDVTVASILRPVRLEPVVTRLYNEMHYGRTEALLSLSLLAATTPILVASGTMLISWLMERLRRPVQGQSVLAQSPS